MRIVQVGICAAVLAFAAPAQEVYAVVELGELEITQGRLEGSWHWAWDLQVGALLPRVQIDGDGHAGFAHDASGGFWSWNFESVMRDGRIHVQLPAARDVTGTLFLPDDDWKALRPVRFKIQAAKFAAANRSDYLDAERLRYLSLLQRGLPGGAWFRHRLHEIDRELGVERPFVEGTWARRNEIDEFAEAIELFGGGRAIAENLQLDRALADAGAEGADVDVTSIEGIKIKPIDWTQHLGNEAPALDPLAALIPHDQHAVFLPSASAAQRVIEEVERRGTAVAFVMGMPRAEEHALLQRYERQLGVELRALVALGDLVGSLALTGSDFEFRMGTDVALLLSSPRPAELREQLQQAGVELHELGGTFVLTNSKAQLARLRDVAAGKLAALAKEPEFRFFRLRYPLGAKDETAFAVLSDATIRRWCDPQWRIASARRVRAAALLGELTARHAADLAQPAVARRALPAEEAFAGLGTLRLDGGGVHSERYGTLTFLTPIVDLNVTRASAAEADAYRRWREGYERNWSGVFDPIAVQCTMQAGRVTTDVTVMPLILGSEYNWLRQLTRTAKLSARPLELAEPLAQLAFAIEPKSNPMRMVLGFAGGLGRELGADPFGWMGQTVAIYADQDPFWAELAQAKDREEFFEQNWHRLPLGLVVEVDSALKATAFLAGLRAYVQDTAPGMTQWQSIDHAGGTYVRVSPSPEAAAELSEFERRATFSYTVSGRRILVALNENLVRQALERGNKAPDPAPVPPGEHAWLRVGALAFDAVEALIGGELRTGMQVLAWRNLPILEEWARKFPGQDPVTVHERLFGVRLVCPGGGQYLQQREDGMLASSVFGHPAAPRTGPAWPPGWRGITGADFGLTFEQDGLRARAEVRSK